MEKLLAYTLPRICLFTSFVDSIKKEKLSGGNSDGYIA